MKIFRRSFLPDTVEHQGKTYKVNADLSAGVNHKTTAAQFNQIQKTLRGQGRHAVCVKSMSKNVRGRTDLHGQLYQPTVWIFVDRDLEVSDL